MELRRDLGELAVKYGWSLYDHIQDSEVKIRNTYHQLYLEKPLVDVLRGTKELEQQVQAVCECARPLLLELTQTESLRRLKRAMDAVQKQSAMTE